MCTDTKIKVCQYFQKGITKLPWTIAQLVVVGILLYSLADTYPGNWIRCHLFDANGCAPRVKIEFAGEDVTPSELIKKKIDYDNLLKNWPKDWKTFIIKEYKLIIDNVGIQNIQEIILNPSIISKDNANGLMLLYKIDGRTQVGSSKDKTIKLTASDFRKVSSWSKERATLSLVGAVIRRKGEAPKPELRLELICSKCQVKFEKVSYR